jgi:putative salt-induced outer membrane protein
MFGNRILLPLLCAVTFSQAFITIEPEVIGVKKGARGELSVGAVYSSGNTDNQAVSLSAKAQYDSDDWLTFIIASYNYGEAKEEINTNEGLMHLRYIHSIYDTLYDWEIFLQSESNEFQNLHHRDLAGGGLRRRFMGFFDTFYIGLGLFHSHMEPKETTPEDLILNRGKINSYISFKKTFSDNLFVTYLGYYQPNIEDFSDYSSFQLIQFNTPLIGSLLLSLDLLYRYNATPYADIEKGDFKSTLNLKYSF